MKLPFDFGVKLIFRLVLPGFILSLGFLPLLRLVLQLEGWSDKWEYAFVVMVILLGWAIVIADMPIYILMEGRRFWPERIRKFAMERLRKRLDELKSITQLSFAPTDSETSNKPAAKRQQADDDGDERPDAQKISEAWFDVRNSFQMNDKYEYEVVLPSRLGNVIYAYESHSKRSYGLDSIFYWPRIWLKLDKDLREEIDSNQALADSTVYAAFALYTSALLWLLYAVAKFFVFILLWIGFSPRLQYDLTLIDQRLPKKGVALLVAVICVIAGYLVYRVSLFLYAQFGEHFKAVFDVNMQAINVAPVMEELYALTAGSPCPLEDQILTKRDQFQMAARYLQYHLYRCPCCSSLLKLDQVKTHTCKTKGQTPFDQSATSTISEGPASPGKALKQVPQSNTDTIALTDAANPSSDGKESSHEQVVGKAPGAPD
jgi:hypothetical protein